MSYTPCSDLQAGGSLLLYRCRSIPDTLAMKHVLRNNQCGEIDACHTCHVGNYRRAGANLRVGGGTCCFIAVDPFPDHLRSSTHCAITGVGDVYIYVILAMLCTTGGRGQTLQLHGASDT